MGSYITEALSKHHQSKHFSCGDAYLDNYIQAQAIQDVVKKLSACYVYCNEVKDIQAYYTLSSASIDKHTMPLDIKRDITRKNHTRLPVILLGRLAIDQSYINLKPSLLIDALKRSVDVAQMIGSIAVVVNPFDKAAIIFYAQYGFILLPDSGKMFMPMQLIEDLFND